MAAMTLDERVCYYAKRLVDLDLMASMSGNISVRLPDDRFLMTPTACMKDELHPDDLVVVNGAGERVAGQTRMSTEGWMHLAIYKNRPDVQAIVHAHPITVTALGIVEDAPNLAINGEGAAFVGPIAMVPWFIPGTKELGVAVGEASATSDALILRQHGAVTSGTSLEEAFARMQSFEHVAKMYVVARQLSSDVPRISPEDIARMRGA